MISFKGVHFPKEVILYAVFFYVRYGVSYRDLEEIMEERGVQVDHATLNRWVINYSPLISAEAKKSKRTVATSWRMDETYIKVKGKWVYLYRVLSQSLVFGAKWKYWKNMPKKLKRFSLKWMQMASRSKAKMAISKLNWADASRSILR